MYFINKRNISIDLYLYNSKTYYIYNNKFVTKKKQLKQFKKFIINNNI